MSGTLVVKPQYARLTHDTEFIDRMAPYCVIKIGSQFQSTNVCNNGGKNPSWSKASLSFRITIEDLVNVEVWDKDLISKNDLIGQGSLALYSIVSRGPILSENCYLTYKGVQAGFVNLVFEWYPGGGNNYPPPQEGQRCLPANQTQGYQQPQRYPPANLEQEYQQPPPVYQPQPVPGYQQGPLTGYLQGQTPTGFIPYGGPGSYEAYGGQGVPGGYGGYQRPGGPLGYGGIPGEWTVAPHVTKHEVKKYREQIFWKYDRDHSGYLSYGELSFALYELFAMMKCPPPPESYVLQIMYRFDKNRDGMMSYKEFKKFTKHLCKFDMKKSYF